MRYPYARQVRDVLKKNGWKIVRQGKGSHEIWGKPGGSFPNVSVPHNLRKRHSANEILKQCGINLRL